MVQGRAMPDQPCIDAKLLELRLPAGDQAKLGKVFALGSVFEKNQAGMQRQQPFAIANDAWRQTCITQQPLDRRTDSFQKADAGKQGVRPNQFDPRHTGQMSPVVQRPANGRDIRIFFHASWRKMTRSTMLILLSVTGWVGLGERSFWRTSRLRCCPVAMQQCASNKSGKVCSAFPPEASPAKQAESQRLERYGAVLGWSAAAVGERLQ